MGDVFIKDDIQLEWNFDSSKPRISWGLDPDYSPFTPIDPFPGYPHNLSIVRETVTKCTETVPLPKDLYILVAQYEDVGRTNGWTSYDVFRDKEDKTDYVSVMFLSGKRIPPHPGVTRYVVAHEYGHAAFFQLAKKRNPDTWNTSDLEKEYAVMRSLNYEEHKDTKAGTWHKSIGEIAACDFRSVMIGAELEYWPHQGIEYPLHNRPLWTRVYNWWYDAALELREG